MTHTQPCKNINTNALKLHNFYAPGHNHNGLSGGNWVSSWKMKQLVTEQKLYLRELVFVVYQIYADDMKFSA